MIYTEDEEKVKFEQICELMEAGESLREILKRKDMPTTSTFYTWLTRNEDRQKRYSFASEIRADILFDKMIEVAENPIIGETNETINDPTKGEIIKVRKADMIGHRRLLIDTLKWQLAKLRPEKFGNKIDVTSDNEKVESNVVILPSNDRD